MKKKKKPDDGKPTKHNDKGTKAQISAVYANAYGHGHGQAYPLHQAKQDHHRQLQRQWPDAAAAYGSGYHHRQGQEEETGTEEEESGTGEDGETEEEEEEVAYRGTPSQPLPEPPRQGRHYTQPLAGHRRERGYAGPVDEEEDSEEEEEDTPRKFSAKGRASSMSAGGAGSDPRQNFPKQRTKTILRPKERIDPYAGYEDVSPIGGAAAAAKVRARVRKPQRSEMTETEEEGEEEETPRRSRSNNLNGNGNATTQESAAEALEHRRSKSAIEERERLILSARQARRDRSDDDGDNLSGFRERREAFRDEVGGLAYDDEVGVERRGMVKAKMQKPQGSNSQWQSRSQSQWEVHAAAAAGGPHRKVTVMNDVVGSYDEGDDNRPRQRSGLPQPPAMVRSGGAEAHHHHARWKTPQSQASASVARFDDDEGGQRQSRRIAAGMMGIEMQQEQQEQQHSAPGGQGRAGERWPMDLPKLPRTPGTGSDRDRDGGGYFDIPHHLQHQVQPPQASDSRMSQQRVGAGGRSQSQGPPPPALAPAPGPHNHNNNNNGGGIGMVRNSGSSRGLKLDLDDPPPSPSIVRTPSPGVGGGGAAGYTFQLQKTTPSTRPRSVYDSYYGGGGGSGQGQDRSSQDVVGQRQQQRRRPQTQIFGAGPASSGFPFRDGEDEEGGQQQQQQPEQRKKNQPQQQQRGFSTQPFSGSGHQRAFNNANANASSSSPRKHPQTPAPPPTIGIESPYPVGGRDKRADIPRMSKETETHHENENKDDNFEHPITGPSSTSGSVPRINISFGVESPGPAAAARGRGRDNKMTSGSSPEPRMGNGLPPGISITSDDDVDVDPHPHPPPPAIHVDPNPNSNHGSGSGSPRKKAAQDTRPMSMMSGGGGGGPRIQVFDVPGVSVSGPDFDDQNQNQNQNLDSRQQQQQQRRSGPRYANNTNARNNNNNGGGGGGLICGGCHGPIVNGRIVSAMGLRWHPSCFNCTVCDTSLEHVSSYEHEGRPYCHLDYHEVCVYFFSILLIFFKKKQAFAPRCYSCKTAIIDEQFISLDDPTLGKRTYHTQHFFCSECGDPFLDPSAPLAGGDANGAYPILFSFHYINFF